MLFVWWLVGETTLALLLISTGVIGFERAKKLPRRTVRIGIRIVPWPWPGWELSSYGPKTLPDFCPERDRIGHKLGWQVLEDGVSPTLVGGYATPVLVPDSFEGAFGYSGNLRFVKFGYRRVEVGRN